MVSKSAGSQIVDDAASDVGHVRSANFVQYTGKRRLVWDFWQTFPSSS